MSSSELRTLAPIALSQAGLPVGDGDLDVLEVVAGVFAPAMEALDAFALADFAPEPDLDPSRAPRA